MPTDNDDDDPALAQFLADCRHFMANFPTLWGKVSEVPVMDRVEVTTDALVAKAHAWGMGLSLTDEKWKISHF